MGKLPKYKCRGMKDESRLPDLTTLPAKQANGTGAKDVRPA
jgi:hypothetical protein